MKRRNTRANNVEINPEGNEGISNERKKRQKTESINPIPKISKNRKFSKCKTSKNASMAIYKPKYDKPKDYKHKEDKVTNEESISHLSQLNIYYNCVYKVHDDPNKNDSEYRNIITYKEKTEFTRRNELSKLLIKN